MKLYSYIVIIIFLLLHISCHKMPTEFQESFSCKVNGQYWEPNGTTDPLFNIPPIWVVKYSFFNAVSINAFKDYPKSESVSLPYVELKDNKILELKNVLVYSKEGCGGYLLDTTKLNFVKTITLDSTRKILKGIFQFECNGTSCNDNIKITEGQFEVKY